jgi:hypothetical protein
MPAGPCRQRRYANPLTRRSARHEFGELRGQSLAEFGAALLPAVAVEGGVVHLLIPSQWIAVHAINALAHVYAVLWILSWGFGSRAYPHRLTSRALTVRNGPFYPAVSHWTR